MSTRVRDKPPIQHGLTEEDYKKAINAALDLLHRRWVLRILWELRAQALNFRQLQVACGGLSMSVLSTRLNELRAAGLVDHEAGSGYSLSEQGHALMKAARPLLEWSAAWAARTGLETP